MENTETSTFPIGAVADAEMSVSDGNPQKRREIGLLTKGLAKLCQQDLDRVTSCLKEVLTKQDKLRTDLLHLNQEYSIESREDCRQMFADVKEYTDRLHVIKKQMTSIHQRVKQLKKRANALKSFAARESSAIRQRRLNEEALIANSTTSSSTQKK